MKVFLRAKHWQLFVLLIGIPFFLQIIVAAVALNFQDSGIFALVFSIEMILFVGVYFGWFYALGTALQSRLPASAPMNVKRFKLFLILPLLYLVLIMAAMPFFVAREPADISAGFAIAMVFIVPLHLFSMFCIFYCLYFIAKSLKAVERQRPVTFSDYAGEFFLIWFFPIGVWFIQPRINKMFDENLSPLKTIFLTTNEERHK